MTSYRDAGVNLDGASEHVSAIAGDVTSTWSNKVVGSFGGFAAGVAVPDGFTNPILMMSTDGVGTKLELARRSGIWEGVGADLVAMCVDDLAAVGALPLGFVDYMAVGELRPERDSAVVRSIAHACSVAGCPLLGGETAEHPGVMEPEAIDLAGAAMGVVEQDKALDPSDATEGNLIVGLSSPNLRSNGFSLVRRVLGEDIDLHIEELLSPSVIYSPSVLRAVSTGGVRSAAHITGGGIVENLERALPHHLGAEVDTSSWSRPSVFGVVTERGVTEEDMFRTFNMGLGFCLVIDASSLDDVLEATSEHAPAVVGRVTSESGVVLI